MGIYHKVVFGVIRKLNLRRFHCKTCFEGSDKLSSEVFVEVMSDLLPAKVCLKREVFVHDRGLKSEVFVEDEGLQKKESKEDGACRSTAIMNGESKYLWKMEVITIFII